VKGRTDLIVATTILTGEWESVSRQGAREE
jgi:hypothetical protein